MDRIDLHTHSTCSDGSMTPAELVRHAKESGLCAMALSDHDTVSGVDEAMATGREFGIEVIPAIELSAVSATETHILGYFIDPHAPELVHALGRIRDIRVERLTANLLQAQRDYFGAHTYERIDAPRGEFFHTDWNDGEVGTTASTQYNA